VAVGKKKGEVMEEILVCPLLLAAWTVKHGESAMGFQDYCNCNIDCAWFNEERQMCAVKEIAVGILPK
jgi:hypothetical protein